MSPGLQIALLGAAAIVVIALGGRLIYGLIQRNPEKRERKRRLQVNRNGRLGEALVTEASQTTLYYSYSVRGVHYSASQDISALRDHLPAEPERLIGQASLKYSPKNPANSILVCEDWCGLRAPVKERAG